MLVMVEYSLLLFWPSAKKYEYIYYCTLKFLLAQDHMGLEFQNYIPLTVFIPLQPNFIWILAIMVKYSPLLFLAISQVLKQKVHGPWRETA